MSHSTPRAIDPPQSKSYAARMFARQLMRAARQTAGQVSSKETRDRHVSRSPLVVARAARRTAVTRCPVRGAAAAGGVPCETGEAQRRKIEGSMAIAAPFP